MSLVMSYKQFAAAIWKGLSQNGYQVLFDLPSHRGKTKQWRSL